MCTCKIYCVQICNAQIFLRIGTQLYILLWIHAHICTQFCKLEEYGSTILHMGHILCCTHAYSVCCKCTLLALNGHLHSSDLEHQVVGAACILATKNTRWQEPLVSQQPRTLSSRSNLLPSSQGCSYCHNTMSRQWGFSDSSIHAKGGRYFFFSAAG